MTTTDDVAWSGTVLSWMLHLSSHGSTPQVCHDAPVQCLDLLPCAPIETTSTGPGAYVRAFTRTNDPSFIYYAGLLHENEGDVDQAITCHQAAVQLYYTPSMIVLARIYRVMDDAPKELACLLDALHNGDPLAKRLIGEYHERRNDIDKAMDMYCSAIRDNDDTTACRRLGKIYRRIVCDLDLALECYRIGAELGSNRCKHRLHALNVVKRKEELVKRKTDREVLRRHMWFRKTGALLHNDDDVK